VSYVKFAEISSPFRPFSPAERDRLEEQMQATYELFLSRVAEGRKSTPAMIDAVAQGRVWTGHQARERGLVDELGGLDRAIQLAKERAKLDINRDVDLLVYPPRPSLYQIVANPFGSSVAARLGVLTGSADARAIDTAVSALRLFRRGEPLALMPNFFVR